MATEATIRKRACEILKKEGYIVWYPAKVKYYQNDIFGLFDCVAVKDSDVRYIQWTSAPNMSARKKKIETFFNENEVWIPCEIWGYKGNGKFKFDYL